jgi:predicted O-methyltransferase YrrM
MELERLQEIAERAKTEPTYRSSYFPPSMYYRFLKLLAEEMKPKLSVELGVCGGGGSLHLALGHPEGKVIGVDFQYDHPKEVGHVESAFPNFEFMLEDSTKAAKKIHDKYGKIDILFIDTDHTYEKTIIEYNTYKPFLSENAVVCFDDILRHHPDDALSMEDAWDKVKGNKVRFDFLHDGSYPHGGGFGVKY